MSLKSGLTKLHSALDRSLKKLDLEGKLREARCLALWEEIVGEPIASATQADSIKEGTLFVSVKSSSWTQELTFLKPEILRKLNERLGRKVVKEIQFKTRTLKKEPKGAPAAMRAAAPEIALEEEELKELEAQTAGIEDEELRASVLRMLTAQRRLERAKKTSGWRTCERCGTLHAGPGSVCTLCESSAHP